MATRNRNNILFNLGFAPHQNNWPLSTGGSFDFQEGDLLWWDSTGPFVKALDSDAHAANLVGVAGRPAFLAPYASQVQTTPGQVKIYDPMALALFGCVATFFSVAGDTLKHGNAMYYSTDAQTLTSTVGGNTHSVGTVYLPQGGSITGASTTLVPVLIVPQIPIQSL